MRMIKVDVDLVRKYNVAGPRYTSYPPATHFTERVTWQDLQAPLRANNDSPRADGGATP